MIENFNKRIEWIDAAKGIGILLVVIGHSFRDEMRLVTPVYNYIYTIIYYFHMPLFFAISGYLLEHSIRKANSILKISVKKVKTILVPFLSYSMLIYVLFKIASFLPVIGNALTRLTGTCISLKQYIYSALAGNNPYAFHLWYLLVLFLIEVFAILFLQLKRKLRVSIMCVASIILYFVGWNVYPPGSSVNTFTISAFLKNVIFFSFGQVIFCVENRLKFEYQAIVASVLVGGGYSIN